MFHRLFFDIESPRAAFDALKYLCPLHTENELLLEAKVNASGNLHKISFPWLEVNDSRPLGSVVIGQIKIEGQLLTVEVNSDNRAKNFREIIHKVLPDARYKNMVIESPQSMPSHRKIQDTERSRKIQEKADELASSPESQNHLSEMMRNY